MIVAEIEPMADVFIPMSKVANELLPADPRLPSGEMEREFVGGRWLTQSWTSRLTFGFERRFPVFFELGFVVMIMFGPEGSSAVDGKG